MEIIKGIEILGKSLWIKKLKTLILADLHTGYEEALNKQGLLVPRTQFKETISELNALINEVQEKFKTKPLTIVINGDLKHEFGEISQQEWIETTKVLDLLLKNSKEVILVKGNHDTMLEPIAKKKKLKIVDYYMAGEICILHGDKIFLDPLINAKTLIIAHEHPAISLNEGPKRETYKCFLYGSWKNKKLIVMPSFLTATIGYDIQNRKMLSPFLKQGLDYFDVYIVGDKVYKFGKLKNI
jgi:hypothetical protein